MTKHKKVRRSKKNILSRGFSSLSKTTKKIIPGVTSGIEGVGKRVVGTAKRSVPKAQSSIRNLFGMFGLSRKTKTRKTRKTRRKH
jgi:hypothetical protein